MFGGILFERPGGGERALLMHLRLRRLGGKQLNDADFEFQDCQREFEALCLSAGCEIIESVSARRYTPDLRLYMGKGKAEEIRRLVVDREIELVIFNHRLSPVQERNLEALLKCRVLDRTGLILDIFAQRARSFEGKLQVELAQLKHLATRLVRGWTHLERQKGGIGLRGPGETQLETDRRLIGHRIKKLAGRLQKVSGQREQGRRSRAKAGTPTVALVGYTSAGKSTLFNQLTNSDVYVADQLFATLDPTLRRLSLNGGSHLVLADTVGFVRDLPHDLIAAFRSTLSATRDADLLLHVVDAARIDRDACIEQVEGVLRQIGTDQRPVLMVYNKCDLLAREPAIGRDEQGRPTRVWLSAREECGVKLLKEALTEIFRSQKCLGWILLEPYEAALRAQLYENGVVLNETTDDQGRLLVQLSINQHDLHAAGLAGRFSYAKDSVAQLKKAI